MALYKPTFNMFLFIRFYHKLQRIKSSLAKVMNKSVELLVKTKFILNPLPFTTTPHSGGI